MTEAKAEKVGLSRPGLAGKVARVTAALLLASSLALSLAACGSGDHLAGDGSITPTTPSTVSVKTGALATDSWGYTGASAVQIAAPDQAEVVAGANTLLEDALHIVVSGISPTKVSYSTDVTTLSPVAQATVPGEFVSYLDLSVGTARTAIPALSVTVDVGSVPAGQTLTVCTFDAASGKWGSPQSAVVGSAGKITFPVGQFSLWGIFKQ